MATRFELVLVGDSERELRAAGEAAVAEIEEVALRLNRFDRASFARFLEREACSHPVRLDQDLYDLFELCLEVEEESAGAFSITHGSPGGFLLDPEASTVRLSDSETRLDFGAVAKGFALDLAADELRECPALEAALLHGGTSTAIALGTPPMSDAWKLSVRLADDARVVQLTDRALSASAQAGRQHIADPRPGRTADAATFAAVTAPTAALADAWSTALAVLGTDLPPGVRAALQAHDVAPIQRALTPAP